MRYWETHRRGTPASPCSRWSDACAYLGGSNNDVGTGIAVDAAGRASVVGYTGSPDFPTAYPLPGAAGGGYDIFVERLAAGGRALQFGTYLGGSADDIGSGVAADAVGSLYVAGYTASSNFPTAYPAQAGNAGATTWWSSS